MKTGILIPMFYQTRHFETPGIYPSSRAEKTTHLTHVTHAMSEHSELHVMETLTTLQKTMTMGMGSRSTKLRWLDLTSCPFIPTDKTGFSIVITC